jgi:hypothetical protein
MKIQGKKIEGPNVEIIPIPRAMGKDIVFMAKAVLDMEPFELMCPAPTPPKKIVAGGQEIPNLEDKGYLDAVQSLSVKRLAWIVLTSLTATEGLEWETVDLSDHNTWENFRKEMKDSGFSDVEINRVVGGCISVNSLNDDKIEAARERFLLEAQEALEG